MDWVETTGKDIEEATERALAHLGVHRNDADVEVIEEPKTGLFGRVRGEARIRARVRPSGPRPKRSRRGNDRPSGKSEKSRPAKNEQAKADKPKSAEKKQAPKADKPKSQQKQEPKERAPKKEETMGETIPLAEQGQFGREFLEGLLASMNIMASVSVKEIDDETLEIAVDANPPSELGVLVGPRGTTLQALQEITRTFIQTKSPGRINRILVDVAQYRERRVAALGNFAAKVAAEVVESGEERALEPMSSADRKAIHDALTNNADVATRSEGEEPRRFVVIAPA